MKHTMIATNRHTTPRFLCVWPIAPGLTMKRAACTRPPARPLGDGVPLAAIVCLSGRLSGGRSVGIKCPSCDDSVRRGAP